MEEIKKTKKYGLILVILCSAVYMISYITRINYSSVLVEIISAEGYTKSAASVALTAMFITYGFGQIISGFMGDRFKPEKLIFGGLLLSGLMNILIPLAQSTLQMTAIWAVNGFAQALMWPPIVKILTKYLSVEKYKSQVIFIGWGGQLGTVLVYLISPVTISVFNWRAVFYTAAACAILMAVVWIAVIYKIEANIEPNQIYSEIKKESLKKAKSVKMPSYAVLYLCVVILAVAAQGLLRDGIMTWMPTYIKEQFNATSSIAILTGVGLPVFGIFVSYFATYFNRRFVKNENLASAVFFGVCFICNLLLCFTYDKNPAISVSMLTLINATTHGINLMFTCMIIPYFNKYGKVSFITGLVNSATYIGSALSTYVIPKIAEAFGWGGTMFAWCIAGAVGIAFSVGTAGMLKKIKKVAFKA